MILRWVDKHRLDGEFSEVITQQGALGVTCEINLIIMSFMIACFMSFMIACFLFGLRINIFLGLQLTMI